MKPDVKRGEHATIELTFCVHDAWRARCVMTHAEAARLYRDLGLLVALQEPADEHTAIAAGVTAVERHAPTTTTVEAPSPSSWLAPEAVERE